MRLRSRTSLNKEVRLFFLSNNRIWNLPSVSSLSNYRLQHPEGYFTLVIRFMVSKYDYRVGNGQSRHLNLRRLRSSRAARLACIADLRGAKIESQAPQVGPFVLLAANELRCQGCQACMRTTHWLNNQHLLCCWHQNFKRFNCISIIS